MPRPTQPKTYNTMAPHRWSTPSRPRCTHPWKTPRSPRPSLLHDLVLRPDTPLSKRVRETFRISASYDPTTCSLESTRIGYTQNPVKHLDVGIAEDGKCQYRWEKLVGMLTQCYDVQSSKVRRIFFGILSVELDEVRAINWNSDRVIVFQ